jgi:exodeoxyribonuclease V alpha subunit
MKPYELDMTFGNERFRDIDIAFAQLMERLAPDDPPGVGLAALLVSRAAGEGHVCIDLHQQCRAGVQAPHGGTDGFGCPPVDTWLAQMAASPVVGRTAGEQPLVCDHRGRVYLQRLYQHEQSLAARMRQMAAAAGPPLSGSGRDRLPALLTRYFPPSPVEDAGGPSVDWQKRAAAVAAARRLCIISGAPGTGKTTTVAKIIGLLMEAADPGELRVSVCAPTGKAAARLGASLAEAGRSLDCPPTITAALNSLSPCTIHRLLRVQQGGRGFYFNASNPLPTDLVVVDEASMVDLVLMNRLLEAVPPEARMIILGDKDQLASVEAGSVFGDLCRGASATPISSAEADGTAPAGSAAPAASASSEAPPLQACIVVLRHNYRFDPHKGIGALTQAVNCGEGDRVKEIFKDRPGGAVRWESWRSRDAFHKLLAAQIRKGYEHYLDSDGPAQALARFGLFRILCALSVGPFGVDHINAVAVAFLQKIRLIPGSQPWFPGRPVMITRNDYRLGLFNGDTGLAWPDPSGHLRVWFQGEGGALKSFSPQRLPPHQTVFAMTVHKSQGSEFDRVLLVLPEQDAPVLTRELVYTGCSRARRELILAGREDILDLALARKIQRVSGLSDALRNA